MAIEITVEPLRRRVLVRRLATPLASAEEAAGLLVKLRDALAGIDPRIYVALVDLRPAPIRDETLYRDAMRALRRALVLAFRRTAFLVETQVGLLQVTRYPYEEGLSAPVFLDEKAALAHLSA